jgi:ankyrin repeat protein
LNDDKVIVELVRRNKNLNNVEHKVLKFQSYVFSRTNGDGRNVLHLACNIGNHKIVQFLLSKAGPTYLGVLNTIINAKDNMGLTPLYLLCQRGYRVKSKVPHCGNAELDEKYQEHLQRPQILKELVTGVDKKLP